DSNSSFILFGFDGSGKTDALRLPVYNAVCNLIGTTNGNRSMCINIPIVKYQFSSPPSMSADMKLFVNCIVAGLRDAMKDCAAVVKSNAQTIYFAVPESMKEALTVALEKIE
ncbi:MAG TPA: hypothetical protein PLQ20_02650, partial [Candidatus Paceibacterota bacterium]|nr:hypothetical protein [Candidatus Paceibacterota bacterium]